MGYFILKSPFRYTSKYETFKNSTTERVCSSNESEQNVQLPNLICIKQVVLSLVKISTIYKAFLNLLDTFYTTVSVNKPERAFFLVNRFCNVDRENTDFAALCTVILVIHTMNIISRNSIRNL